MVVGSARCSQICLYVLYSCCSLRSCVGVSFGSSSRSVSVTFDEVYVVVVLRKNRVKVLVLVG